MIAGHKSTNSDYKIYVSDEGTSEISFLEKKIGNNEDYSSKSNSSLLKVP